LDASAAVLADLEVVTGRNAEVKSFGAHGDRIAAVVSTSDNPGEVELVGTGVLTDFAGPVREGGVHPSVELTGTAPDGYPVHGFLVLPEGEGPHPVLLAVHGGPFMYHGHGFFDEAQVYASAGYAVVLPNPRGSAGYGQEHGQAVIGAFGTVDVDDVLAVLDAALERPELDADRVGVMGGSYGGFMTSWLAAHHGERFRAGWSERAVNAWDSFGGSSDIGWFFVDAYCGTDPAKQQAMSPLTYAEKISMPFAVVHSEHDWRCPLEQAQRMFVALRRNGVDAEMLIFPGEGHELTRSGKPRHRHQRFDAVLEWWSRHLG
jgi:dipeptidyl aminopeptidase/acylaminoacyl peptidase